MQRGSADGMSTILLSGCMIKGKGMVVKSVARYGEPFFFFFFVNIGAMRMFLEEEEQRLNMEGIERRKRWKRKKLLE